MALQPALHGPRRVFAACAVVAVAGLALSACGGGSATADGRAAAADGLDDVAETEDPSVALLASELSASGSPLSADQSSCLATVLIDVLDDAGILDPAAASSDDPTHLLRADADLDALDGDAIGAGVADCGITFGTAIAEAMGGDVDDALVACLDEQFTPDVIGQVLLADMTGASVGERTSEEIARGAAIACAHLLPDASGDPG